MERCKPCSGVAYVVLVLEPWVGMLLALSIIELLLVLADSKIPTPGEGGTFSKDTPFFCRDRGGEVLTLTTCCPFLAHHVTRISRPIECGS